MKKVSISSSKEAIEYEDKLRLTAEQSKERLIEIASSLGDLEFLKRLKFDPVGLDPLDCGRDLNLIEQINQTFTYLASFRAARILLQRHKELKRLYLNLGTVGGSDIESDPIHLVACEVFSATKPSSNNKLNMDIKKVLKTEARYKYVFFMCPDIEQGIYPKKAVEGVTVWSLGV